MTRLGVWIATSGPAGYAPIAPGTVGSAVGVVMYATRHWPVLQISARSLMIAVAVAGCGRPTVAARHFRPLGSSQVVIDEVAGQLLTFLGLGVELARSSGGFPPVSGARYHQALAGEPARSICTAALGIMADDLMAAVYANSHPARRGLRLPGWL